MKIAKTVGWLTLAAVAFGTGYAARASKPGAPAAPARRVLYYVDPMHPAYKSDKPGVAPDCGMTLEPVYTDGPATPGSGRVEPDAESDRPMPPGAFNVPPARQQLAGVRFATVEWGGEARAIRTVGKVAVDETRVAHVHTRTDGWIEKVFVDFTGDVVKQGEPMLTIYSPEMLASQEELLLAARARDLMRGNPLASAAEHGQSLFDAARRRLEQWQLSDAQIQQVLETGQPIHSITLNAPASGYVSERKAFPNQKVTPDSDLYTITDLSRVWIMADVFEADIPAIKIGDAAYVMFPTPGTPSLSARVNYIQPQVDPVTRTLKVRLDVNNPAVRMKPDMFVNVEFGIPTVRQLLVPAEAVLDSGDRQTVFVDLGDGYLEPRAVAVGERFGDRVAITRGLSAGERVVATGTFLIDSESQLRAAASDKDKGKPVVSGSPFDRPQGGPSAGLGAGSRTGSEHRHD